MCICRCGRADGCLILAKQLQNTVAKREFSWKYEGVGCVPSLPLVSLSQQIIFKHHTW